MSYINIIGEKKTTNEAKVINKKNDTKYSKYSSFFCKNKILSSHCVFHRLHRRRLLSLTLSLI